MLSQRVCHDSHRQIPREISAPWYRYKRRPTNFAAGQEPFIDNSSRRTIRQIKPRKDLQYSATKESSKKWLTIVARLTTYWLTTIPNHTHHCHCRRTWNIKLGLESFRCFWTIRIWRRRLPFQGKILLGLGFQGSRHLPHRPYQWAESIVTSASNRHNHAKIRARPDSSETFVHSWPNLSSRREQAF